MSKPFTEAFFSGQDDDRDRRDERLPSSDPLALFHHLAAPPVQSRDVTDMKAAVAELRRARELSHRSEQLTGDRMLETANDRAASDPAANPQAARARRPWRFAAAAAFLLSTVFFFGGPARQESAPVQAAAAPVPQNAAAVSFAGNAASHLPLIEDLDPRQAELIQFEDEGVSLVVVLAAGPV